MQGSRQSTTSGQGPTMQLIHEIMAAFNGQDADRIVSFFAEDCTFYMASGPEVVGRTVRGKAALRKVLADRFVVIPDMQWDPEYDQYTATTLFLFGWSRVTPKMGRFSTTKDVISGNFAMVWRSTKIPFGRLSDLIGDRAAQSDVLRTALHVTERRCASDEQSGSSTSPRVVLGMP